MADKIKKTLDLLDNFDKEQKELSNKVDNENKHNTRINEFIQYEFNKRYLGRILLIGLPIIIGLCFWVIYGNTFNDGFIRFFIFFIGLNLIIFGFKVHMFYKLKEEFALLGNGEK